ncbi:MAG: site-specific DNA-methyltransferase, partial [Nitrososphaeraceae archaeon]|nr:site-specific DNA-methyltransferase [Nitrososphaeraceae archaeon]
MSKPLAHSSLFDKTADKSEYLSISDKEIIKMIKTLGFKPTLDKITDMLSKYDFPYKEYYIPENVIKENFKKLSNYKFKIVETPYQVYSITFLDKFLFDGKSIIMEKSPSDYLDYNIISDYFQEDCRIKCKRYDAHESPEDYWIEYKSKVVAEAIKKYGKINVYTLRESLYQLAGECTSFRPTIMVSLIHMFKAKRILDFSSGWGDRLIGAMAANAEYYCGVDPNTCLHPNYDNMIKFFGKDKKKFNMIQSPFETAKIPNKKYDLVCTSPPYFTLETYSEESTQSISSYNENVNEWLENFLYFSIKKAWKYLIPGGHMVIIINDMKNIKFVEDMINFVKEKIKDSEYRGVIGYGEKVN